MASTLAEPRKSTAPSVADDPRWARIVARDKTADGHLWYSVATTGVYCRPSCPSRTANPQNVQIHDTLESAKATGFRPCKRCNPDGPPIEAGNAALVAKACRTIEDSEEEPSLEDLASAAGRSPSHFHRLFKAVTGLTPKDYAAAQRAQKVRQGLVSGDSVTEAIYGAGFNSSGRFYEKSTDMLGMTPSRYRAGGTNEAIKFAIGQTSLGAIVVASSEKGVAAILLGDDPDELVRNLQDRFAKAHLIGADPDYEALVARVVGLVEAPKIGLDLPLDVRGTAFQRRVWQALQEIPAGATASYAEIARRIGQPKSIRAVAGACAANKLAVAIPCHRVVHSDGSLSGYAWGVDRKRALIDREVSQSTGGMMMSIRLPQPIAQYFDADSRRDEDGFVGSFAEDAVVRDEGERHVGPAAIRQWWRSTKAKYDHTSEPFEVAEQDGKVVVRAKVSGNFPGSPANLRFAFILGGEKITSLEIG